MIRSIRDKRVQQILDGSVPKRFPPGLARAAERRLKYLMDAVSFEELRSPPSNRLEALRGDRAGWFSMRINRQWRICFRWADGAAENVEIVDYH
ncbi:MAG: type II toxin-antitoxin system RelE/ParE family toxin [Alphaproteobacteria bacterium]|nr:type II toxin-antitoxin system RelE/ParE family toxin [Alphaproteobacteria bacterium]